MTYSEVEQEIDQVQQEWIDAVKQQDAAALERIVADDFLIASDTLGEKLGDKKLKCSAVQKIAIQDARL